MSNPTVAAPPRPCTLFSRLLCCSPLRAPSAAAILPRPVRFPARISRPLADNFSAHLSTRAAYTPNPEYPSPQTVRTEAPCFPVRIFPSPAGKHTTQPVNAALLQCVRSTQQCHGNGGRVTTGARVITSRAGLLPLRTSRSSHQALPPQVLPRLLAVHIALQPGGGGGGLGDAGQELSQA